MSGVSLGRLSTGIPVSSRPAIRSAAALLLLAALPALAHTRLKTSTGADRVRTDVQDIHLLVNQSFQPGVTNTQGFQMITADSDPMAAVEAAAATWNRVPESIARFAAFETTALGPDENDNQHVIVLQDDAEIRSALGSALAITRMVFLTDGTILDTDILLNPDVTTSSGRYEPYSTTGAPNTRDIQAILTHELGHVLGAGHSGFLGAAMFQSGTGRLHRTLSTDDVAFLHEAYLAPGKASQFGALSGKVTYPSGLPVRSGLVSVIDPGSGVAVSTLTGRLDGNWRIPRLPPGDYTVFVEPLDGPVLPENLNISGFQAATDFAPTLSGGSLLQRVSVTAGSTATATVAVNPPPATRFDINFIAVGSAGGTGDFTSGGAQALQGGATVDVLIGGPGISGPASSFEVFLAGPGLSVRAGSLRFDDSLAFADGRYPLRFTVEAENPLQRSLVTVFVRGPSGLAVYSGGLVVEAPPLTLSSNAVLNAASLAAGPLAPDSWVSVFASPLAPGLLVGPGSPLALELAGTTVAVIDSAGNSRLARLQFVSPGQLNFLMPRDAASGAATLLIRTVYGEGIAPIQIAPVAAGLFSANGSGAGPAAATFLQVAQDDSRSSGFTFDASQVPRVNVPLDLGSGALYVTFYGTGLRAHQSAVTATIGGMNLPVLAAVGQPEFPGLDQINAGPIPPNLAGRGAVPVVFSIDGQPANPITLAIE